jgi:hypothetical protein
VDILYLIPNKSISDCQNYELNSLSLSVMIISSVPCCANTVLVIAYTSSSAVDNSLYSSRYIYFVRSSFIVSILS